MSKKKQRQFSKRLFNSKVIDLLEADAVIEKREPSVEEPKVERIEKAVVEERKEETLEAT